MAIITEEPDTQQPPQKRSSKNPKRKLKHAKPTSSTSPNPFIFWFYFTLSVSLITLISLSLSSLATPKDPKSYFLSLPFSLRHHYLKGRTVKVQTPVGKSPIEVFTVDNGKISTETVFLVHGFGLSSYSFRKVMSFLGDNDVHAVAVDLPGHGFSDKSYVVVEERASTGLERIWNVYEEIKEKGLFWGFDRIVETGEMPYEEIGGRRKEVEVRKVVELGTDEMGSVLGEVVESLGSAPIHLVLHDSALGLGGASWVRKNAGLGLVRSVTLVDTGMRAEGALPLWVLDVPIVREVVLGVSFAYSRLINRWCSKRIGGGLDVDAHRLLLRGRDGRRAVVGMGKRLNYSFDLAEWGASEGVKGIPMQVLWSRGWSEEWSNEGHQVAEALPNAKFVTHSGGRWPQEDAADELAHSIAQFVFSLPKTVRYVEEGPLAQHIQKVTEEAKVNGHHHHGHEHDEHDDAADYMDAYGLGRGYGS